MREKYVHIQFWKKRTRGYGHVQIMADNRWHARTSARVDITRKKEKFRQFDEMNEGYNGWERSGRKTVDARRRLAIENEKTSMKLLAICNVLGVLYSRWKLLKVHWHGWNVLYTLSFRSPQNEKSMYVRSGDWGIHDLSTTPGMFGSGTASHPCDSGVATQFIAKWHSLICDRRHSNMSRYTWPIGSLGWKEWHINLCSSYSTENIDLLTVLYMFDNLVRILQTSDYSIIAIHIP
jgi:hypothetical protein